MEDMKYITQTEITLHDILSCLTKVDYEGHLHEDGNREELIIYYNVTYQNESVDVYCRWSEDNFNGQEDEYIKRFQAKDVELKYLFNIEYRFITIDKISSLLQVVLDCYGGYIYCEKRFFNKLNIKELQEIKLGS